MNNSSKNNGRGEPHYYPTGSIIVLSSAAMTMFLILSAFVGYSAFNTHAVNEPWFPRDIVYLTVALLAAIALGFVPWIATRPGKYEEIKVSTGFARLAFLSGCCFTLLSIVLYYVFEILYG